MFQARTTQVRPIARAVIPDFTRDKLPVFASVPAGFPSPAEDHAEGRLDVHDLLIRRPSATFYCRADGDSMRDAGIHDGDLLVVDRSIPPEDRDIVVAAVNGGMTVKRLVKTNIGWALAPENPDFPLIPVDYDDGLLVWGVVTYAITELCSR